MSQNTQFHINSTNSFTPSLKFALPAIRPSPTLHKHHGSMFNSPSKNHFLSPMHTNYSANKMTLYTDKTIREEQIKLVKSLQKRKDFFREYL